MLRYFLLLLSSVCTIVTATDNRNLMELLEKAQDKDTIYLSGTYHIDKQIIVNKRISLVGKDAHTKIIIDARKDKNAGIWYYSKHGFGTPRSPLLIHRIAFEAHPGSVHEGVGLAFVATFSAISVEYCTFKNLGRRALLIWGTLFSEFNQNFFRRSGILGLALRPGKPKEKWGLNTEKLPLMELNQIQIRGGEMQYGFPGSDYVVELSDIGTLIMDNFCIEAIPDQGVIKLKNATSVMVKNLWLEAIGTLQELGKKRNYDGIISLEDCGAIEFSGGHIGSGTFLRTGFEYNKTYTKRKLHYTMAPVFALTNVSNFTIKKVAYGSELITPGFLKIDKRSNGIFIRENLGKHFLALSSSYPITVKDNCVSGTHPWLLQANQNEVDSKRNLQPIESLKIPELPPRPKDKQLYCWVLKLQLQSNKAVSTRIQIISSKRNYTFPLEAAPDGQVIRIGLQDYDFAKTVTGIRLFKDAPPVQLKGAIIKWQKVPVNLRFDIMGRKMSYGHMK